ncbi:MAG: cytochrome c maturation protein CcmE [Actinomycetota bacterium]
MDESSSTPVAPPSRKRTAKFAVGGGAVALTLVGLLTWATGRDGATAFYMTPTELVAAGASTAQSDYRVNGKVVPGSITQNGLATSFVVSDGITEVQVTTDRPLPDAFKEESEVIARGHFNGELLVAEEVLAKCPSKFKAKA